MAPFYKIPVVNPIATKTKVFYETLNQRKICVMQITLPKQSFATLSLICLALAMLFWSLSPKAAVLIKNKQWQKGMVLNVVFLDGTPDLHKLVRETAPDWLQSTSLSFRFFDQLSKAPSQTHIRISFTLHSGSQLGDHQDYVSKYPTMNLFDLTLEEISDSGAKRLILHEFGHALGFEHEYRSSHWPYGLVAIERIIKDCYPKMETIGYSHSSAIEHCQAINATVDSNRARLTAYDELSIMNYPMSFERKNGQSKRIRPVIKLSILDRYAIQLWYAADPG